MANAEEVLEFFLTTRPRVVWEIDEGTLSRLRNLRDCAGTYFWKPEPNYPDMPGTLFGVEISIAKDKCFQLRSIFSNGESQITKPDFTI